MTTKAPPRPRTGAKATKRATTKRPAPKRPATKRPAAKRPATKRPATKRPAAKRAATKRPAAKRPATKRPATKRPATKRAATNRSATKRPTATRASNRPPQKRPAQKRRAHKRPVPKLPVTQAGERAAAGLTLVVIGLTLFGLVMVLSATSVTSVHEYEASPFFQFQKQFRYAGIGALAFVVAARIDYRWMQKAVAPLLLLSTALLVAVLIPGVGTNTNGSSRWLNVGPVVIQPAELAKVALIVAVANLLAKRQRYIDSFQLTVVPVMGLVVGFSALLLLQPKLGTPIVMGGTALLMLYLAGSKLEHLTLIGLGAVMAASVAAFSAEYRMNRLLAFMDPWEFPTTLGLQTIQSQVGIASGGFLGVGLGASRAKWGFLPEAQTDFIFAVAAEELGVVGAAGLITGFLLFGYFGIRAAWTAPDFFGFLLAAGITIWIMLQAFLNIGMALGQMPVTGEPLPFVSAGGSSLITTLGAAGLLVNVARRGRA